jgi:predicted dithiol-disulfide oxidoreductase (DUF899 family)
MERSVIRERSTGRTPLPDYASLHPGYGQESNMDPHKIVSHDEWLTARKAYLAEEKAFTRARDALSKKRRELPWEKVKTTYVFDGPNGKATLADHFDGAATHLAHRDVAFVVVSRAPLAEIEKFKRRMGWHFTWVSSFGSDFNHDYQVSASPQEKASGQALYNYEMTTFPSEERPGASVFYKNDKGEVFHTYSTYGRGLDMFIGAYHFLDIAPKGRDEAGLKWSMAWVRHHDRYDNMPVDTTAQFVEPKKTESCCD